MARRRGNSNWSAGIDEDIAPAEPTQFEKLATRLGLHEESFADSIELKEFARRNRDKLYVPEALLKTWRLESTKYADD